MQPFFDKDRWKIDMGPGKPPIGHYEAHCLYPVAANGFVLYVRTRRYTQIVARRLADNMEFVLDVPSSPMGGIAHFFDGRFVAFTWGSSQDKPPPYDARDVLAASFDTQRSQWVDVAGRRYVPLGDSSKPKIAWIFKTTAPSLGPNDLF